MLQFAAIVIFITFWNARSNSWIDYQVYSYNSAVSLLELPDGMKSDPAILDDLHYHQGKEIAETAKHSLYHARDLLRIWDQIRFQTIYNIYIPVFGITMSINDLGL
ncbi:MAG: hypothetical protein HY960_10610 [Ignavibacteriae bacterium]|nr:hypothetical protein [Ignavibacteriota bacterium]